MGVCITRTKLQQKHQFFMFIINRNDDTKTIQVHMVICLQLHSTGKSYWRIDLKENHITHSDF